MSTPNLPTVTPAEAIAISPEGLEVANTYLRNPSPLAVAEELEIPIEHVTAILERDEVRAYINNVYFNVGFNNRFTVRSLMDTIIQKKLQDMDESDTGSTKDITEILALSHKMTMEQLAAETKLLEVKLKQKIPTVQTNVQINDNGGGNYGALLEKLMKQG